MPLRWLVQVRQSFATSLKELKTEYLDSLVLHSPMQTREETAVVWKEFEKLVESGQVSRHCDSTFFWHQR